MQPKGHANERSRKKRVGPEVIERLATVSGSQLRPDELVAVWARWKESLGLAKLIASESRQASHREIPGHCHEFLAVADNSRSGFQGEAHDDGRQERQEAEPGLKRGGGSQGFAHQKNPRGLRCGTQRVGQRCVEGSESEMKPTPPPGQCRAGQETPAQHRESHAQPGTEARLRLSHVQVSEPRILEQQGVGLQRRNGASAVP